MGKPKRQQMTKSDNEDGYSNGIDLDGEGSWVIVKKQKVTILIPPLSHSERSAMPKPGTSKLETMPVEAVNNKSSNAGETSCKKMPSGVRQEKVIPVADSKGIRTFTRIPAQHISASHKPPRQNDQMDRENLDRSHAYKSRNVLGASNISKTIKRPIMLPVQRHYLDGSMLNKRLRASLLEKKLQKAGGLSRWLSSLGLGQFVKIFEGKAGKFQLVNLTMKKLKDMGADAVGPRRKLMHAIDCICQPYCFTDG